MTGKPVSIGDVVLPPGAPKEEKTEGPPVHVDPDVKKLLDDSIASVAQSVGVRQQLKTLQAADKDEAPPTKTEGFGETAQGMAALITALQSGGDKQSAMLELLKYFEEHDKESLRAEIVELKRTLTEGSGADPTLTTITALKELGVIGNGHGGDLLTTIQTLKELGLIQPNANGSGMMGQLTELAATAKTLRDLFAPPPPPAQPVSPTVVQIPGGGDWPLSDLIMYTDAQQRWKKDDREHELSEKRVEAVKDIGGKLAGAITEAARSLQEEDEQEVATPAHRPQLPTRPRMAPTNCDHCGKEVQVDPSWDVFTCPYCEKDSRIERQGRAIHASKIDVQGEGESAPGGGGAEPSEGGAAEDPVGATEGAP